jgi:hypothetical protein
VLVTTPQVTPSKKDARPEPAFLCSDQGTAGKGKWGCQAREIGVSECAIGEASIAGTNEEHYVP